MYNKNKINQIAYTGVYAIQSLDCNKNYVGETSRLIQNEFKNTKEDFKNGEEMNAVLQYNKVITILT